MNCCHNSRLGILRRFTREECGAATIEAVLWLPMFVMIVGLLADVSMIFFNQSRILRVAQDANRNYSIDRLTTDAETEAFVLARLAALGPGVTAHTEAPAGLITTTVTVPLNDLDLFGVAGFLPGSRMTVTAEHLMED